MIIAITIYDKDDPIVDLCKRLKVKDFRVAEEDVLSRSHEAALLTKADIVTRVTSDCSVIDPAIIEK